MTISFFSTRNRLLPCLLLPITIFLLYSTTASCASITDTRLPSDEVEALMEIGRTLGKADWDFNEDPCNGSSWFSQSEVPRGYGNAVNCTCDGAANSTATVCHIVSISLRSQNLSGTLPSGLAKLPFLQNLDLTRNYLNGSIPREWGSMRLVNISLLGNRLSGSIPKELGNISTLANLTLEQNQFSGEIPPELGNLPVLEKIFLNVNNFTGELPLTFANLVNLREFRIGDNNFTGKIPNYVVGWTRIQRLMIQGMEGPIPLGIANLTNLIDLRITDLYGPEESTFPPFRNMRHLRNLILRNCNITGPLPPDSFGTTDLKILDLSFNKLSGPIPDSFFELRRTDYIYLTGNLLSGNVSNWMLNEGQKIDLSYNNFTLSGQTCQPKSINLFAASSKNNVSGILSCLGERFCPEYRSFLYIDCGGPGGIIDGKNYEKDDVSGDASRFFEVENMWGFSSTGHFIDDDIPTDTYIVENASRHSVDRPDLYMNARRAPLSLTYYGDCLRNGNYTVKLHFAEIMFTDDETYSSLGRRIFDIYIQGKIVEKDFNIKDRAGGVGKEIITSYPKTLVDNGTLEIRFFWAGKGTTAIPFRGVYGPLISAISVEDGPSDGNSNGNSISGGAVAGIVVGVAIFIMLVLWLLWWTGFLQHEDTMGLDLKGIDLNSPFTLRQIKAATNNFASANKIGEGGFGSVYKGVLPNGITIAVKQLSSKSKQGNREFLNEIGMISALQHQHLVKMHGCCIEGNQLLLVYEYMENNSLARALFGPEEFQLELDWPTRYQICIGIARGLAYLHEESRLKIVHRDIKATNVLLDKNLVPKISDFGLAKLDEEENTHISTRVAGTYGYMAPEYALRGYLTDKADVYSYGIVVLEIVSGMGNIPDRMKENHFTLHERALKLKEAENLMELVDPKLGSEYNEEEIMVAINVALLCTKLEPSDRPMMSTVVSLLEERTITQEILLHQSSSTKTTRLNDNPQFRQVMSMDLSQDMSIPYSNTSTSTADLYPPILDSEYLEKRDIPMTSKLLP